MGAVKVNILVAGVSDNGGASWWASQAINRYTGHQARGTRTYDSYIEFPHDILNPSVGQLIQLCQWADVIHVRDTVKLIPPVYRRSKPIVLTMTGKRNTLKAVLKSCRRNHWLMGVSTYDLTQFLPEGSVVWTPNSREDLAALWHPIRGEFRIAHAPTSRLCKGTETVIRAVSPMDHPVTLDVIERQTYAATMGRKQLCRCLIDQFTYGYGSNSIEAWALGMPVISGSMRGRYAEAVKKMAGFLPYIKVRESVEEIRGAILEISGGGPLYFEAIERGREYFFKYHHMPAVAKRLIGVYEQAISYKASG